MMGLLTNPNELTMKETYAGLIYGQPGVGKTTLALSSVNPVCIDVDRGMYRVERRYQVPSLQVENYRQVLDLLNSAEMSGFDTVIIDTLGKLVDRMGEYVIENNPKYRQANGQLTMQGWGQVKIEFRSLVKQINSKNKSVIFVAHESEEKEEDVTKKRPDVAGSARKDIVKELDFMGYMEMSGNKRTISFAPSGAYYAKNSLGLDSVIEIPGIQTANSFIRDVVVSAIERKREQDKIQAGPYDEVIKRINSIVSAAGNVAAINEALGKVSTLNHIWDSRIYAWSKLSAAAEALGASWDKAAKRFAGSAAPPVTAVPPPEPPPAKEAVPPPEPPAKEAVPPSEPPAKEAPPPLAGANGNTSGAKPDVPASRPHGNTGSRKTTPEPDTPPVPAMDEEDEEEEPEDYEEEEPPEEYDGPEINDEDIPFWDDDKSPAAPPPPAKEPAAALDDRDNHEPPWEDLGNRPAEAGRSVRLGLSEGFDRFIRKKKTAGAMAYEEDIF